MRPLPKSLLSLCVVTFMVCGCRPEGRTQFQETLPPSGRPKAVSPKMLPCRIVSMSPALTEMVFALGQGKRVVGVSAFCSYPPEVKQLPECGGLIDPNFELLSQLKPDLVLVQGRNAKVQEWCKKTSQLFISVELETVQDILLAPEKLGKILGCEREGTRLAHSMREELNNIATKAQKQPDVPVFLCLGRESAKLEGLLTAGRGTFLHEIVEMCGGRNVFSDLAMPYPQPSIESLLKRRPEVVIELGERMGASPKSQAEVMAAWQSLVGLPAVRKGRVFVINESYALIPGPRITLLARRIAQILHPEVFQNG